MTANDIRNIALLGHGGSGKTSLAEQMLFMTKGTDRLGRTADGNTTCDYDAEEIKRAVDTAIEALGGERPPEREFSGDPYYESLRQV